MLLKTCLLLLALSDHNGGLSAKSPKTSKSAKSAKTSKYSTTTYSSTTIPERVVHINPTTSTDYSSSSSSTTYSTTQSSTTKTISKQSNSDRSAGNFHTSELLYIIPSAIIAVILSIIFIYRSRSKRTPNVILNETINNNNNNVIEEDETLGGLYDLPGLSDYLEPQPMPEVEYDLAQNNNLNIDVFQNNTIYDNQYELAG